VDHEISSTLTRHYLKTKRRNTAPAQKVYTNKIPSEIYQIQWLFK